MSYKHEIDIQAILNIPHNSINSFVSEMLWWTSWNNIDVSISYKNLSNKSIQALVLF